METEGQSVQARCLSLSTDWHTMTRLFACVAESKRSPDEDQRRFDPNRAILACMMVDGRGRQIEGVPTFVYMLKPSHQQRVPAGGRSPDNTGVHRYGSRPVRASGEFPVAHTHTFWPCGLDESRWCGGGGWKGWRGGGGVLSAGCWVLGAWPEDVCTLYRRGTLAPRVEMAAPAACYRP